MTISPTDHTRTTIQRYYQYLAMHPKDTSAMLALGHICFQHDLMIKGIDALEHARSIEPKNLQILWPLACAYQKTNAHKKLKPLITHALSIEPDHLGFQHMHADYLTNHEDPHHAEHIIQSLLKKNPHHIPLMISLAQSFYHQNKVIRAQRVVDQIKKIPIDDHHAPTIQSLESMVAKRYKALTIKTDP